MEYKINDFADLTGVTTRTLRYYDEIGLLKPERIDTNGYRIYGPHQVDIMQQILFFRSMGISLSNIKEIIYSPDFEKSKALEEHLSMLNKKKAHIDILIKNINKTIASLKGEKTMADKEKFEGFKDFLITENEEKYGKEIREKYTDKVVNKSNQKLKSMADDEWQYQEDLKNEIFSLLKRSVEHGIISDSDSVKLFEAHRDWLKMFATKGLYSKEYHISLGEMYVSDERFTTYYDSVAGNGASELLRDVIIKHAK